MKYYWVWAWTDGLTTNDYVRAIFDEELGSMILIGEK